MSIIKQQFRVNNPYKPDEIIIQDVVLSNSLHYDYSDCEWVAIDAEFLGLNKERDALCCVQIASEIPTKPEEQRIEIVYTYNQVVDESLKRLLRGKIEKIFHVFTSDIPMLEKYLKVEVSSPVFDTKVASKLIWTNGPSSRLTDLIKTFVDPRFEKSRQSFARWEQEPNKWTNLMIEYAAKDVIYLNRIKEVMIEMAKERGRTEILEKTMKAIPAIARLYSDGYDVNVYTFEN